MRFLRKFLGSFGSFAGDKRGNFAVTFAVASPAVALAVGFGINLTQLYHVKSNLAQALDAAVTSTARDITTGAIEPNDARKVVKAFLDANTAGFPLPGSVKLDELKVNRLTRTIEASASVDVALAFPMLGLGDDTKRVSTGMAAVYSDKKVEIAMMLDVTGSMAPENKLVDLKEAAAAAVEALLDGQGRNERIRVSVVPFANSVNAGALAESSVFVERQARDRRQAPGNGAPRAVSVNRPDNCATERKGLYAYSDAGPDVSMVNRDLLLRQFASAGTRCPDTAVVPLTTDRTRLLNAIDSLRPEGGTAGHIGIQWTWYMLSPEWRSVLEPEARPAEYDEHKILKIAILMTDGEFNLSYFDADDVGEVYNGRGKAETREAAARLCREMHDRDIVTFTIGFKLREWNAKETMRACASEPRFYFEADTGAELMDIYMEIVRNVENLTIVR